jgi:signal peptidase II
MSRLGNPEPSVSSDSRVRWKAFGVAAVALGTDVVAKIVGVSTLTAGPVDLPGPLDLRLVHNSGVAFGVGAGLPVGLVIGATAAVTILLAVMMWRGGFPPLAGGLILGGAIANVVDRIGDGVVIDVFDLGWWPTFNLADVWITLGVAIVLLISATTETESSGAVT